MSAGGFSVERRQILLDKPIKALGLHEVRVALHPEVTVKVAINVARSTDEAERQARGEDVTLLREELPEIETYSEDGEGAEPPGLGEQPDV